MKINIIERAAVVASGLRSSQVLRQRLPWALPILIVPIAIVATVAWTARAARAETVGRAEESFDNARSDRQETAWGRLVTDAVRATGADIALVNAGVLGKGKLDAGDIDSEEIESILAYPDEEIVIVTVSGTQLRAGLERAVGAFPTGSPAWLHGSGLEARFAPSQSVKPRLTSLRVRGQNVEDGDSYRVAMPQSLAKGGSGYFAAWGDLTKNAKKTGSTLSEAVVKWVRSRKNVSPDSSVRIAPQS